MSFRSPSSPKSSNSANKQIISLSAKNQILFDDYEGSEFEYNADNDNQVQEKQNKNINNKKKVVEPSANESIASTSKGLPSKNILKDEQSKSEGQIRAFHFMSMNAYSKHKKLVNDYLMYYSGGKSLKEVFERDKSNDKTDMDVIREEIKFIWDDDDTADTWEKRIAKRYYDKLFKEYCICDLSFYKQNKIAMRWRIEKEVIDGKGQFICGDKKCVIREGLKSWEVNFGYVEHGEKKNALVKLRLCPDCSFKLNFHHQKKEAVKPVKIKKKHKEKSEKEKTEKEKIRDLKRKKESSSSADSSQSSSSDSESHNRNKIKKKKEENDDEKGEVKEKEELDKDGKMILLKGDNSMWKAKQDKQTYDDLKSREDDFEDYLEDLLL